MSVYNIYVSPMDQAELNAQAAAAESIAEDDVEVSSSNVGAETGQKISGALAQLTACYREISDDDDDDDGTADDAER